MSKETISEPKTVTLISEARIRTFYVDQKHIVKVHRGTQRSTLLNMIQIAIDPGSIVTFTEEFAKHLLTYKEFKVYGI